LGTTPSLAAPFGESQERLYENSRYSAISKVASRLRGNTASTDEPPLPIRRGESGVAGSEEALAPLPVGEMGGEEIAIDRVEALLFKISK
jgi:hypothetical protein